LRKGDRVENTITDADERAARENARVLLGGTAFKTVPLTDGIDPDRLLEREQRGIDLALKILNSEHLAAQAAASVAFSEEHRDEWRELARKMVIATVGLDALNERAQRFQNKCSGALLPLAGEINDLSRAISFMRATDFANAALAKGIVASEISERQKIMADALDLLRQDALQKRMHGVAGGLRICWSAKDTARIHDHISEMRPELIARDMSETSRKLVATDVVAAVRAKSGIKVRDAAEDDRDFLFIVSSEDIDLMSDVISVNGIDTRGFNRNPVVLDSHNSSTMPVATSSAPSVSGKSLTAVAQFPKRGVSKNSDRVAAAVRGRIVRGASVGFVPIRWSFSKDPGRKMGVDFHESLLLEWSVCALPANPSCLLLGAVAGGSKSASRRGRNAPLLDDVPDDDSRWTCQGSASIPIDATDDPFDSESAKASLLASCSKGGAILSDEAAQYFLACDSKSPWDPASYVFPFARVTQAGYIGSKIGWRQSLAALEKSTISNLPVSDARALVDQLESRLGDVKMAGRRREARLLAAKAKQSSRRPSTIPRRRARSVSPTRIISDGLRLAESEKVCSAADSEEKFACSAASRGRALRRGGRVTRPANSKEVTCTHFIAS
jgi:hypothetical protein